jgi:predicted phage-related endonuclease
MDLTTKAKEYRELQVMIKELEAEADAIKQAFVREMEVRETDTLQADIFTIRNTSYQSSRIDTSAFKKELPDVAARYTKTTEARRFSVA